MNTQNKPEISQENRQCDIRLPLVASGILIASYGILLLMIGVALGIFSGDSAIGGKANYTAAIIALVAGLNFLAQGILLGHANSKPLLRIGSKLALGVAQTPIAIFIFGWLGLGNLFTPFLPDSVSVPFIACCISVTVSVAGSLGLWVLLLLGLAEERLE